MNDTAPEPKNTKQADRRHLAFATLDEIRADLDRIEQSNAIGTIRTTGNWSAGKVFDHLARFWECSLDGFPPEIKAPWFVRIPIQIFFKKKAIAGASPPSGMKLPDKVKSVLVAEGEVPFDEGLARLRACIDRTDRGDPFTDRSPIFGELTRDNWVTLNRGHCALHLGFIHP